LKNIAEPIHVYSLEVGQSVKAKIEQLKIAKHATRAKSATLVSRRWPTLLVAIAIASLAVGAYAWHAGFAPRLLGLSGVDDSLNTAPHLSIVVLPFKNLSSDPSQDKLADSLTDTLTSDLSQIRNSYVIAANTALTFKNKSADAKEIGKQLGVRYLLEGSIDRGGERTRLNAQLIDAETGAHLWANRLEENAVDAFELQDRLLGRLAAALRVQLVIAEADRAARAKNPDTVDFAMRGRALMQTPGIPNREQNDAAIAMFEQALKLDPNEPDALAGLALAYARNNVWRWAGANADFSSKILALSNRAIELDPHNVTAYTAKTIYYWWFDVRPNEAIRAASAGIAIDPSSAALYAARGAVEQYVQRSDDSIADVEKARRLNRYDPEVLMFANSTSHWN
jgi:TolB-like protein